MPDQRLSLIAAIKKEHMHLSSRIELLKQEMRGWSNNREPNFPLLELLAKFFRTFPGEIHHRKEDYIYDALIRVGVLESDYLVRLKSEHEVMHGMTKDFSSNLGNLLDRASTVKQPLIDNINKYIDLQELHMADEESQFLPLAESILPEARFIEIDEQIRLDLITDATHQAFRDLRAIDHDIRGLLRNQ